MSVLILETIEAGAMAAIAAEHALLRAPTPSALDHNSMDLASVAGIVTRGRGHVDTALLAACPALRVVARCGAGVNNIDLAAAAGRGIAVLYTPGANAAAVAEHTVMLMLMALRRGFAMAEAVRNGAWSARDSFDGDDLQGKRLCIVGPGAIGSRVAALGAAFGADIQACGRGGRGMRGLRDALQAALPEADIVSLHIPLDADSHGLFDAAMLARLRPGATLVNTARGELVDAAALLAALQAGQVGAYAADVVSGEVPDPADPLVAHPRAIVTPHVASLTAGTYRAMSEATARNLLAVLRGEAPDPRAIHPGGAPAPAARNG